MRKLLYFSLLCAVMASAQETPVTLRRMPAGDLEQLKTMDFGHAIEILKEDPAKPAPKARVAAKSTRAAAMPMVLPPSFVLPSTTPPPPAAAREAIGISAAWASNEASPPQSGKDGRVVFVFGAGLPVITCAPLKVCVIELQAGEHLTGEPKIGDAVRWDLQPASVGAEPLVVPLIVLKPRQTGLDTNLLVATDRRAYYLRILSDTDKYVARVGFEYPDDAATLWRKQLATPPKPDPLASYAPAPFATLEGMKGLNMEYEITGKDKGLRPRLVADDGHRTMIQMSPDVASREAPVFFIRGPEGKDEVVNYRVKGDTYIVDRIFDRGMLVLGNGKHARRVVIKRMVS